MRNPRKQPSAAQAKRLLDASQSKSDGARAIEALYPFSRDTKPTSWHRAQSNRMNVEQIQRTDEHIHFVLVEILDELRKMNAR